MKKILLLQLPIPQHNLGMRTGNIPLAAACLKQATEDIAGFQIEIMQEKVASYLGDAAIIKNILRAKPDIIGFTIYNWNLFRSLHVAKQIKKEYSPKIIFGGPEVTPDNVFMQSELIDFKVFGEGENAFQKLLTNNHYWEKNCCSIDAENIFNSTPTPYLKGYIDPKIDNIMYVESQRGCPYRCGFCYYNKSRNRTIFIDDKFVINAIEWAIDNRVEEFSFLDPSLNMRPGLNKLLETISSVNNQKVSLTGEIRADRVDKKTADLFSKAGFTGFEIGLQSINPTALRAMNRQTDTDLFLKGASYLKEREILPRIDLIVGLPGDTLAGFKNSVNFICENNLIDDVQVFPLSVLPGTDFRKNRKDLGLSFEPMPPYTVMTNDMFSEEEMHIAFDYAESMFGVSLFPSPAIDLSFRGSKKNLLNNDDYAIEMDNEKFISKLYLRSHRPLPEIDKIADRLTHPYQVIIPNENKDIEYIKKAIEILTKKNPFTPLELIFHEPEKLPRTEAFQASIKLERPHYLDNDLRFLYGKKGNRAVLYTVLTEKKELCFEGEMKRQVYWWKGPRLPDLYELKGLWELDGILIDSKASENTLESWQENLMAYKEEVIYISFSNISLQKKWIKRSAPDDYFFEML